MDRLGNTIQDDFRLNPLNSEDRSDASLNVFPTCNNTLGSLCFTVVYRVKNSTYYSIKFTTFDFMGNIISSLSDI